MSTREDPEFNRVTGRWEYEDDEGKTWEKNEYTGQWVEIVDGEELKKQQAAYSVPGVDETAPALAPTRKRKIQETFTSATREEGTGEAKKTQQRSKKDRPEPKIKETAVYVQNIPKDATVEEMAALFSKCGLLSEDPLTGDPRIKLYTDSEGHQKGDALVIYFREESVSLAIQMLDDTSLRGDQQLLKVSKASFSHKGAKSQAPIDKQDEVTKKKASRRAGKLKSKLNDWDDEEVMEAPRANKYSKIVILEGMFTSEELDTDPTLLLDLKEDVREECAALGEVTNVVLYDQEPQGIMSVRFRDEEDAAACVKVMHGRFFGGRQVVARIFDGGRRYRKSGKHDGSGDEEERLENFGTWLQETNSP